MTELKTARLRLREMNEADAPFLLEVLNEPAFVRNVGDRGVRTVDEAVQYLRERVTASYEKFGFGMWLVEMKDSSEPIGICGLIKRDALEDVDLGFSFLERFWSRGFAYEAATSALGYGWKVAKLLRIVAIVAPQNVSSIRLLEKLGFQVEKKVRLLPDQPELLLFVMTRPNEEGR